MSLKRVFIFVEVQIQYLQCTKYVSVTFKIKQDMLCFSVQLSLDQLYVSYFLL